MSFKQAYELYRDENVVINASGGVTVIGKIGGDDLMGILEKLDIGKIKPNCGLSIDASTELEEINEMEAFGAKHGEDAAEEVR